MSKVTLSLDECPSHRYRAVCVSGDPKIGGTRLTSSKCCGRWKTVKEWDVDADDLIAKIQREADIAKQAGR